MIQEPGTSIGHNEFNEPVDVASGAASVNRSSDPLDAEADGAGLGRADTEPGEFADLLKEGTSALDAVAGAVTAPDPQSFLRTLVSTLGQAASSPVSGESSLGTTLCHLGHALEEQLDEETAFQDVVNAFDRKHFKAGPLRESVPIVAAFVARIVSQPMLQTVSGATPAEIPGLVRAATQVACEALESGGTRRWRSLPAFATTIARRAAQRNLSIGTLADALPRLWARLGSRANETSASETDPFRARTQGEPRRMILSGPVEIVILER
jgi:hypothetical protein